MDSLTTFLCFVLVGALWWYLYRERRPKRYDPNREWWAWYNAYLQSPEWQIKRLQRREIASGICEYCRRRPGVQCDHLTYARAGHENVWTDLRWTCMECHWAKHGRVF